MLVHYCVYRTRCILKPSQCDVMFLPGLIKDTEVDPYTVRLWNLSKLYKHLCFSRDSASVSHEHKQTHTHSRVFLSVELLQRGISKGCMTETGTEDLGSFKDST